MREIWFAVCGILALAVAAPVLPAHAASPPAAADSGKPLTVTADDRILGNPKAPITIIEYASLTCPHCAHFSDEVLPKIKAQWIDTGKARLILRDFPLDEPAMRAAMVARCAAPDRFYAFVDTFFAQQAAWVNEDYRNGLARLAKLGGMSQQQFDHCFTDTAAENKIAESRLVAEKQLGVDGTPTFFIDGVKYTGDPDVDGLDRVLSAAAKKS